MHLRLGQATRHDAQDQTSRYRSRRRRLLAQPSPLVPGDLIGGTAVSGVVGGLASVAGGGKFENGAVTAAFGYLFNAQGGRVVGGIIGGLVAGIGGAETGPADVAIAFAGHYAGAEIGSAIEDRLFGNPVDGLADLAKFRSQLGLATGQGTLARLDMGGQSFYGINAHGQIIDLTVNPISMTHAQADAFQQAANAGMKGGSATLYVDRALCMACGQYGAVRSMARQLGITDLTIVAPR